MPQPISKALRFGLMPAIIREGVLRRRNAMDDAAFRNCVKAGIDVSAALAALGTVGGELHLPAETIILTARCALTATGLVLTGEGYSTDIRLNATNAGFDFTAISEAGIVGARIRSSVTTIPTAGAAVAFVKSGGTNCYGCFAENIRMEKVYNGFDVNGATNTRLESKIEIRDIHGTFGIRFYGATLADRADKLRIANFICDAPYPYPVYANSSGGTVGSWKGARANLAAYIQGDVVTQSDCIYQCTVAGTTAGSGGPAGSHGTVGSRLIVDGTVTWQFICSSSLSWILQDGFAYSLDVHDGAYINGAYGFRATNTPATGSSYPVWSYFTNTDFDHNAINGILMEAGEDLSCLQCWVSSTLSSNGVLLGASYRGEGVFSQGMVRGNAQHGILLNGGRGFKIATNDIIDNGQAATDTYSNVAVAANIQDFHVVNNMFLPITGQTSQMAKYPILINAGTSDGYVITGNISKGHQTANGVQDGGSGVNKSVTANVAY